MTRPNPEVEPVLELTNRIARTSADRQYIYRGENKQNPLVSSSLYRDYQDQHILQELGIGQIQDLETDTARKHSPGNDTDEEIRHALQHYQGKTNLIDFTEDYLIALFFACDGEYEKDGRLILLDKSTYAEQISKPLSPANRVTAQKSVFVEPPHGYIPDSQLIMLTVPHRIKRITLNYLRHRRGISRTTIYNDLHGFVRQRNALRASLVNIGEAINLLNSGNYRAAIDIYQATIDNDPETAITYIYRGRAYHNLNHLPEAIDDYTRAIDLEPNSALAYNNRGLAYRDMNQYRNSIDDLNRAIVIDPDLYLAYNNRGLSYLVLQSHILVEMSESTLVVAVAGPGLVAPPPTGPSQHSPRCWPGLPDQLVQ